MGSCVVVFLPIIVLTIFFVSPFFRCRSTCLLKVDMFSASFFLLFACCAFLHSLIFLLVFLLHSFHTPSSASPGVAMPSSRSAALVSGVRSLPIAAGCLPRCFLALSSLFAFLIRCALLTIPGVHICLKPLLPCLILTLSGISSLSTLAASVPICSMILLASASVSIFSSMSSSFSVSRAHSIACFTVFSSPFIFNLICPIRSSNFAAIFLFAALSILLLSFSFIAAFVKLMFSHFSMSSS